MAKVLNIIESKIVTRNNSDWQRVIFSDDKIIYVNTQTGDVKPDSAPDKYVDLISMYNTTHSYETRQPQEDFSWLSEKQPEYEHNYEPKPNSFRKAAAVIDVIIVFVVFFVGMGILLSNGGLLIFTLLWLIPMTVMANNSITSGEDHTALGICHLLFFNIPSGILILASNRQVERESR